eukprot:2185832-Amphidinium_carterae.1
MRFRGGKSTADDWTKLLARKRRQHFNICSINGSTWSTADKAITELTEDTCCTVIAIQEHRDQVWKSEKRAEALGWKAAITPARRTNDGPKGTSGGTAVLCRKWIAMQKTGAMGGMLEQRTTVTWLQLTSEA